MNRAKTFYQDMILFGCVGCDFFISHINQTDVTENGKILEKGIKLDHMKEAARSILCSRFDWSVISDKYKKVLSLDQSK